MSWQIVAGIIGVAAVLGLFWYFASRTGKGFPGSKDPGLD